MEAAGTEKKGKGELIDFGKETFGYKTPEAWFAYLRQWREELAHPITIKVE